MLRHTLLSSPASYLRHTPASYPFVPPLSCFRYPFQVLSSVTAGRVLLMLLHVARSSPLPTVRLRSIGTHGDKEGLVMTRQHVQTLVWRMAPAKSHPPSKGPLRHRRVIAIEPPKGVLGPGAILGRPRHTPCVVPPAPYPEALVMARQHVQTFALRMATASLLRKCPCVIGAS